MPFVYRITDDGDRRIVDDGVFRIVKGEPGAPGAPVPRRGDIATVWAANGMSGDWLVDGPSLLAGNDLATAIIVSLFTDRRANPDDPVDDGTEDARGWWGDLGEKYLIGSRLWLLERARLTTATAVAAKGYVTEALQWLIDDRVVTRFDIQTQIVFPARLNMAIVAVRPGGQSLTERFSWVWERNS